VDLLLEEANAELPNEGAVARVLEKATGERLKAVLPEDRSPTARFLLRARWLRQVLPELNLPAWLRELLPELCLGRRSFAELRSAPWLDAIHGRLTYPQVQAIEREAPERLEAPSGSRIQLQYEEGKPPVLAARIQELFGLTATPRLAAGRVPVVLHLLAPNGRAEQITDDVASFWAKIYPQIRKGLRARYPKHAWPEDPLTAKPERGPRRRAARS
jgi:ATP-dependent helicase HrpB